MAVENEGTNGEEEGANEGAEEAQGSDQIANLNTALRQAREDAKAAKEALAARTAAETKAAQEKAEADGEFERLYKELKAEHEGATGKLETLAAREALRLETVTADADAIVAAWNADDKALDPAGLDPDARLRYVRTLDKRLNVTSMPHGTRNNASTDKGPIPEWVKDNYREFHAGSEAKSEDDLRSWMGMLRASKKYAGKFN